MEPRLRELHEYAQQLMLLVDEVLGRTRKDNDRSAPPQHRGAGHKLHHRAVDELRRRPGKWAAAEWARISIEFQRRATFAYHDRRRVAHRVAPSADSDTARIRVAPVRPAETGNILVVDETPEPEMRRPLAAWDTGASGGRWAGCAGVAVRQPMDRCLLDWAMRR